MAVVVLSGAGVCAALLLLSVVSPRSRCTSYVLTLILVYICVCVELLRMQPTTYGVEQMNPS